MFNGVSTEITTKTDDYKDGYLKGIQDTQKKKEKIIEALFQTEDRSNFQQRLLNSYGSFYFNFYNRINIKEQFEFRFIYLCSYINYNGYLSDRGRLCKEEDLQELLGLGKTEYYKTKNVFLENKLIKFNDKGYIEVNSKYCKKGKISKRKNVEVIRMFDDAIQELYKNSTPRDHKKMSVLLNVLPYINYKYNIVSYNPEETNRELIKPIKLTDLCELLGCERSNASRIKRQLFSLRVSGEKVVGMWEVENSNAIIVNPRVYYKGGDEEGLDYLDILFRL